MRIAVVGGGMAAARFAERYAALGGTGAVTVYGAEPRAPYNRVLLAEVLTGRYDAESIALPLGGASARPGCEVVALDLRARTLGLADGSVEPWDELVLATGANPVIEVKSKQDVRDDFSQVITFALNLMYGLLGMAVLIAVLGVINTLAMSVFERKREIGMLRAIGLDRSGIKRMVRLESVVISLFGAGIGLLLGCFIAWAINGTLKSSLAGLTTVLPYGQLALFLGLAGLVGLVAAIWPARRAAKLDILESIKTD